MSAGMWHTSRLFVIEFRDSDTKFEHSFVKFTQTVSSEVDKNQMKKYQDKVLICEETA